MKDSSREMSSSNSMNTSSSSSSSSASPTEIQALYQKFSEIELEQEEHRMVIDTLRPMQSDRPAYRLINGVLVERTVGEVLPLLEKQLVNIESLVESLRTQLAKKQNELNSK